MVEGHHTKLLLLLQLATLLVDRNLHLVLGSHLERGRVVLILQSLSQLFERTDVFHEQLSVLRVLDFVLHELQLGDGVVRTETKVRRLARRRRVRISHLLEIYLILSVIHLARTTLRVK